MREDVHDNASQQAPGALRNLVMVCLGLTSVFIAQTMLLLAVPLRALELGASPSLVGFVLSAPYLLPLVFAIPLGGVVTRLGPQRIFFIGASGMMLGPWLSVVSPTFGGLVATQVVVGLAQVVMVIAAQVMAPLVLGMIAELIGFTLTFLLAGGVLLAALAVVVRLAPAFDRAERDNASPTG